MSTEEDATIFLNKIKNKYWDAKHNTYAYFIQGDIEKQKFSDDGEPTGTAGIPILEIIKKLGVKNVIVVVTRYFGGILLGTAGLIKAYGKSARVGIINSKIAKKMFCTEIFLKIDYNLLGKVNSLILTNEYIINEIVYDQNVNIKLFIPILKIDEFILFIKDITDGTAIFDIGKDKYILIED